MRRLLSCILLVGCAPGSGPGALGTSAPAPESAATPTTSTPAPPTSAAAPPGITLTLEAIPLAAPSAGAALAFVRPSAGEVVAANAARAFAIRVERSAVGGRRDPVERKAVAAVGGVLVSLDGGRPRALPVGGEIALSDLVPADRSVTAGPHSLFAVLTDAAGYALRGPAAAPAYALVDFVVAAADGARAGSAGATRTSAELYCLAPVGTFHGAAAARLPLDVYATGTPPAALPLTIDGPGVAFRGSIDPARSYAIAGLPSGDFFVKAGGAPGPTAECTVTVNRDAEERP